MVEALPQPIRKPLQREISGRLHRCVDAKASAPQYIRNRTADRYAVRVVYKQHLGGPVPCI